MTETKNPGEKTLTVTPTKTLTLKRSVEQGMVRQSFSHGRTKSVVVEKVKRRPIGHGPEIKEPPVVAARPGAAPAAPAKARVATPAAAPVTPKAPEIPQKPTGLVLRSLTDEELASRTRALTEAKGREQEDRQRAEEEQRRRSERDERERAEREAAEARKTQE